MRKNIVPVLILFTAIAVCIVGVWLLFGGTGAISNLTSSIVKSISKEAQAKIINLHSHPQQGENWIVSFETEGTSDLKIIPQDQATIDDDEFTGLYCGEEQRSPQILENDIIYYKDWNCDNQIAQIVHYTKKAGRHTLKFTFGDSEFYAYNAAAWYHPSWAYRKKITVQQTNLDATLYNFPLLVKIASDSDIGAYVQADGDDILFTRDDGITQIPHEEDNFLVQSSVASGDFWVNVPQILTVASGPATDIYVYYGNANSGDNQQVTKVWNNGQVGVWHMGEELWDTTAGEVKDSLGVSDGTAAGNATTATGKIGRAGTFDGTGDYVVVGTGTDFADVCIDGCSFSAWAVTPDGDNWKQILARSDNTNYDEFFQLFIDSGEDTRFTIFEDGAVSCVAEYTGGDISLNVWYHYVGVFNDSTATAYVYRNGALVDSTVCSFSEINVASWQDEESTLIGMRDEQSQGDEWFGEIDNVVIYNRALTAEEIKFQFYNQSEVDNELTWDSQESYTLVPYKLFRGNVKFDGGFQLK